MFDHLQIRSLILMTNNPRKLMAIEGMGIVIHARQPIHTGENPHNEKYLATKAGKLGHLFEDTL